MHKYLLMIAGFLTTTAASPVWAQTAVTELEGEFKAVPATILIIILVVFVAIGLMHRARNTSDYWAAGRGISPVGSGMAIASNWMSAASFLGMAAIMYGSGYHGLSYVVGWTGGYVLLLILMAGQIRRYGKYTAIDFIGDRYYSNGLRVFGACLAIFISFVYCVGQFAGIGLMFKWIFGMNYTWSVILGASVVLAYTLISGMLGVTKNMQVQYLIIIISFILPLFVLMQKFDYNAWVAPIEYGPVVSDIMHGRAPAAETAVNALGHAFAILPSPEYALPWDPATGQTAFQWFALCFSLMIGTAGLPHVIQRFYVVPHARDARWSVVWGLFFICLLYWGAPVYSAFGKILSSHPDIGPLARDAIVVYTAQLGTVHPSITGLLAAGAISAAFSTVAGLLVAGASAFSNDLYYRVWHPEATDRTQMLVARAGTILMAVAVTIVALLNLGLIAQLVAIAFSLAGSTIFPLFLLGIWWGRSNRTGAWAGVVAGSLVSAVALIYFLAGRFGGLLPWQDLVTYYLNAWYFAWLGAPLSIGVNILASLASKDQTPLEIQNFLAEVVHGSRKR